MFRTHRELINEMEEWFLQTQAFDISLHYYNFKLGSCPPTPDRVSLCNLALSTRLALNSEIGIPLPPHVISPSPGQLSLVLILMKWC